MFEALILRDLNRPLYFGFGVIDKRQIQFVNKDE